MFSYCGHQQIAQFRTFGFVVLRALFSPHEVGALRHEVVAALTDAYGELGVTPIPSGGGISGQYLPLSADRAPLSQALIADDPRLFQGAAALLGRPVVPTVPIATCFTSNAAWHTDDGTGIGGVKFLAHLEARSANDGALLLIPGSQQPSFAGSVQDYLASDPARQGFPGWPVPCVAAETQPGDVIAFDVRVFHASVGGQQRLAWSIEYVPWPGLRDPGRLRRLRDTVNDIVDYRHLGYDQERWPIWRDWVAGAAGRRSRQVAVDRLRLLGVLDKVGQERGREPGESAGR